MIKWNRASAGSREAGEKRSVVREYARSILIAVLIAFFVRTFLIQSFLIPTGSMENTLQVGDRIFVNKFIYGTNIPLLHQTVLKVRDPRRGDIIVFEYPRDKDKDFIKRVIGTPGDVIEVRNKQVFVNNVPYQNSHEIHRDRAVLPGSSAPRDNFGPVRVPQKAYFVMGDNRDNSLDSRFWGFVEKDKIKGKAMIKFWSWDRENFRVRWESIGRLTS